MPKLLFPTDTKEILELTDSSEWISQCQKEILPIFIELVETGQKLANTIYGNLLTQKTGISQSPHPSSKTARKPEPIVIAGLHGLRFTGNKNQEYRNLGGGKNKISPEVLQFELTNFEDSVPAELCLRFTPFGKKLYTDGFVSIVKEFYCEHWDSIKQLPFFLEDSAADDWVDASEVSDIEPFFEHDKDKNRKWCRLDLFGFYDSIDNILEEDKDELINLFVGLYPLLEASIALAKDNSIEHFPKMVEKWNEYRSTLVQKGNPEIAQSTETVYFDEIPDEPVEISDIDPNNAKKVISVNKYERDSKLRISCIKKYGCTCVVCGFNFEKYYGDIGKNFIHIHHIVDLAVTGGEYNVTIDDLRPVCPNCHAMLHTQRPAMDISDLKKMLNDKR